MEGLQAKMRAVSKRATILSEAKSISKTAFKDLAGAVSSLQTELFSNLPFLKDQMSSHMDKTVEQGKVEIEAYIGNRLQDHGLSHLQENAPRMLEKDEE
jgi:hypothetical protein